MKNKHLFLVLVVTLLFTASCTREEQIQTEKVKPVRVLQVVEENAPTVLNYTGIVVPREIRKLGFKSPGKILKVSVQKGEHIKSGQVLAQIDTKDLEYALRAAQAMLGTSQAQYKKALNGASQSDVLNAESNVKKAQDGYNFASDTYSKLEALYNEGAITKYELDKAHLEVDLRTSDLNQAKEVYNQVKNGARDEDKAALLNQVKAAQVDVEQKQSMLDDSSMESDIDGYVVDILNKEGEMVGAGYPVLVIRKEGMALNVGVSQNDVPKVKQGTRANVKVGDISTGGGVTNISQIPDSTTRSYNVEVTLDDGSFAIGSTAKVQLITGEDKGIWIPLTSVIAGSDNYVYTVKDDRAQKRKVSIIEVNGSRVRVEGITPMDKLVVEGMLKVKDRDKVAVQQ